MNNITTLGDWVPFLNKICDNRTKSVRIKKMKGTTEEKVLHFLLSACERGTDISDIRESLLERIRFYIKRDEPIRISLSVAIGCKIPNPLKFYDFTPIPTYAWVHLFWFFKLLNEKVKKVYAPGIEMIIFDEASLFRELLFSDVMSEYYVSAFYNHLMTIKDCMDVPVRIIPMKPDMLDVDPKHVTPTNVDYCVTYAMLCSLPTMNDPRIMDPLYVHNKKNYELIIHKVGHKTWNKASKLAGKVNATLQRRKELKLFQNLVQSEYLIDACITRKDGRLSLDITVPCLFNHGVPILHFDEKTGKYKVKMTPEYRIERGDHGNLIPYYWSFDNQTYSLAYYKNNNT